MQKWIFDEKIQSICGNKSDKISFNLIFSVSLPLIIILCTLCRNWKSLITKTLPSLMFMENDSQEASIRWILRQRKLFKSLQLEIGNLMTQSPKNWQKLTDLKTEPLCEFSITEIHHVLGDNEQCHLKVWKIVYLAW